MRRFRPSKSRPCWLCRRRPWLRAIPLREHAAFPSHEVLDWSAAVQTPRHRRLSPADRPARTPDHARVSRLRSLGRNLPARRSRRSPGADGPRGRRTREPWTWVRTQGKGRVFYTAWGHDDRCWRNPGFLNLIERGIRWSTGGDPAVAGAADDPLAFDAPKMTALPRTPSRSSMSKPRSPSTRRAKRPGRTARGTRCSCRSRRPNR